MIDIGSYILDTLQIYFPWDDDLYTYFKEGGFGTRNYNMKALPLIYTDNTISTVGLEALERNYVLQPEYFNKTLENLGWAHGQNSVRPIIPAEKIKSNVLLLNESDIPKIKFKILPNVDGKEQYHIEYSSRAAFGKMYSNWAILYFTIEDMVDITASISNYLNFRQNNSYEVKLEGRQNQREEMHHTEIPILNYKFSLGEFQYAVEYLQHNGFEGTVPSLVYDSSNMHHIEKMDPVLKYGIVYTRNTHGFMNRKPQFVLKVSQPKSITTDGRKKKIKGFIETTVPVENSLEIAAYDFLNAFESIREWYENQSFLQSYPLQ